MTQKSTTKTVTKRNITRTRWAVSVTIPLVLEDKLRRQAKKKNTTMSSIVTQALELYFANQSSKSSG